MTPHESSQAAECFRAGEVGLTLIRSSLGISYSFLVQQYLRILLQQGYMVVLVAVEQSVERYQYALKKTGLNLLPYQQSGQLKVVQPPLAPIGDHPLEPQQLPQQHQQQQRQTQAPHQAAEDAACSGGNCAASVTVGGGGGGCRSALQQLYGAVRGAVEQPQPPPAAAAGVAVILDSLTVLASLRESEAEWAAFLHHCCGAAAPAAAQREAQVPYCVVAGAYGDVPDDGLWLASLEHRANVVVQVEPLPGRIADVDGMVTVTHRFTAQAAAGASQPQSPPPPLWDAGSYCPWRKSLYFKSSELAIKWMDRVTARELL
ncbi:hypothetical protein PLESTB_001011900 [Pleodorina starrii]|uniref:Elongator complex protein 6 n=1 Tax=Pleodorina starrii TaxID=330485 RepID=A0A9W6BPL8_9CHLO|nr:hypothetical protein PLESTB_001011900 [Pleodorina starrii]